MQELEASAAAHHQRAIMKFHGWRPMRCLVDMARNNWDLAAKHYQQTLFRYFEIIITDTLIIHCLCTYNLPGFFAIQIAH